MEGGDVTNVINLVNNVIMINDQLEELLQKYSLDLENISYQDLMKIFVLLDNRLLELIEGKRSA